MSNARRGLVCLLLAAGSVGCGGGGGARPARTAGSSRTDESPTLADTARMCEQVQNNRGLPVGCWVERVDDRLSMLFRFENPDVFNAYLKPVAEKIALPFCSAASLSGREARVYTVVEDRARYWDCELQRWTDWSQIESVDPPSREQADTMQTAIQSCRALEDDESLPISCTAQYDEGLATMTLRFRNETDAQAVIRPIRERVVEPFCDGVAEIKKAAFVYFRFEATQRGQVWDCQSHAWSAPFNLDLEPSEHRTDEPVTLTL